MAIERDTCDCCDVSTSMVCDFCGRRHKHCGSNIDMTVEWALKNKWIRVPGRRNIDRMKWACPVCVANKKAFE